MPDPLVLIIGGTRATGMHAAHALRRRGVAVRIFARRPDDARKRLGDGFDIVRGDVTDKATIAPALEGVSHVIFTAGVPSGRFARQSVVKATEYQGVVDTLEAARARGFTGRFVYMTAIGVRRRSWFGIALNIWKGNTLVWRRQAESAIRTSGLDYVIVRAAFLLNRKPNKRAIAVAQGDAPLTLVEAIGRADVGEALAESVFHARTSRATFELKWGRGKRQRPWSDLLAGLAPDPT